MRIDHVMRSLSNREWAPKARRWKIALVLLTAVAALSVAGNTGAVSVLETVQGIDQSAAAGIFKQYCFQCHGLTAPKAGVSIERLTAQGLVDEHFRQWEKVAAALEQKAMPPKFMPQPSDADRARRMRRDPEVHSLLAELAVCARRPCRGRSRRRKPARIQRSNTQRRTHLPFCLCAGRGARPRSTGAGENLFECRQRESRNGRKTSRHLA